MASARRQEHRRRLARVDSTNDPPSMPSPLMPHSRATRTCTLAFALSAGLLSLAACDAGEPTSPLEASVAFSASKAKTDVCHRTDEGGFSKISVADAAYETHIAHGDGNIGGPVPGMDGYSFGDACQLEQAGAFLVGPAATLITAMDGKVLLDLAESAVASEIVITILPVIDELEDVDVVPGAIYEFGPSPYSFGALVTLTILFDDAALPSGVAAAELRMLKLVDDAWVQIPGSSVDVAASQVLAPLEGFSRYAVGRGKVHDVAVAPLVASVAVSATQQFNATVTNVDGEEMSRNLQWSSSDATVATVDGNGLVTALAVGEATIEARVGSVRGQAKVEVGVFGAAEWSALGTGLNSTVWATTSFNGYTIAGGFFSNIGGTTSGTFNRVARWNGSTWQGIGAGFNATVRSLIVFNGELIAGGDFTASGSEPLGAVSRWDGSQWQPLGAGLGSSVRDLVIYNGELIAVGTFTTVGDQTFNRAARWDGAEWQPLGTGLDNAVNAALVHNGELIVTGTLSAAGGRLVGRIARWNGTEWLAMGDSPVVGNALTVYNGSVVVGGNRLASWLPYIARWDGGSWRALGTGVEGIVGALAVHDGELVAGGAFLLAGDLTVNRIARWNGEVWRTLAEGTSGSVNSLMPDGSDLIVGGGFNLASGLTVRNIARWGPPR
jgi:hypothetical protein